MNIAHLAAAATLIADRNANPPVPAKITRWQGRKWLHSAGLLESIEAAIGQGGLDARIEYEAGEWYRANEFLRSMAIALLPGGTDVDAWLDQMFREAASL